MLKKFSAVLLVLLLCFNLVGCQPQFLKQSQIMQLQNNPVVTITLSYRKDNEQKTVELAYELAYEKAPISVTNFINLIQEDYYTDKVIDTAVLDRYTPTASQYIVGGRYFINADQEYELDQKNFNIIGEFAANGWETNDLEHVFGSLVVFREEGATKFNTASTAFYINLSDNYQRTNNYAVISNSVRSRGKIVSVAEADKDAVREATEYQSGLLPWFVNDMWLLNTTTKTTSDEKSLTRVPTIEITITSIVVDTFGQTFPTAKRIKA